MNISKITTPIIQADSITSCLEKKSSHIPYPNEITVRLRTLHLLSIHIIEDILPTLCQILTLLDPPFSPIQYGECESIIEKALLDDFSASEISSFVQRFLKDFDSNEEFFIHENLNIEAQKYLWQKIILYYCSHYIGFESKTSSLESIFCALQEKFDPNLIFFKQNFLGKEQELERKFDAAVHTFFNENEDPIAESKILLIQYFALLVNTLRKIEENQNPHLILEEGFSALNLFEDVYALLLNFPILPELDVSQSKVQTSELLSTNLNSLRQSFLDHLIDYLVDRQNPNYERDISAIRSAMKECFFLDIEYQSFIHRFLNQKKVEDGSTSIKTRIEEGL